MLTSYVGASEFNDWVINFKKRAIKRKAMSKKTVLKILKSQLSDVHKRKRSHYVINTTKTKKHSFKTVLRIINDIICTDA